MVGVIRRAPTGAAFWLVAGIFVLTMAGGTFPAPLYVLWAPRFGFGPVTTTVLFAVYAVGTALALLSFGRVSDQVGRRPVLMATLAVAAISSCLFLTASSTAFLVAGRFLSGVATGVVTATATAALSELSPDRPGRAETAATAANLGGLAAGPAVAGVLAQYAPGPTTLVFTLHVVATGAALVVALFLPETVSGVHKLSLTVPHVALPPSATGRRAILGAAATLFAGFAVSGLFASLVPSFLRNVLHQHNNGLIGGTVGLFFLAGMLMQVLAAGPWWRSSVVTMPVLLVVGMGLVLAALWSTSSVLALGGTVLAGAGFGLATRSGVSTAQAYGEGDQRADLVATVFLAAYVGTTISTIGLGVLTKGVGEKPATTAVAVVVAVAAVLAAFIQPSGNHHADQQDRAR